jgi:hypothetical protein
MTTEAKPTLEQFEVGRDGAEGNEKGLQETSDAIQLAEAVESTKYSPWTASMFRLYGCLMIAYLCGCLNGYDGSLMGGLNAMTSYGDFFHM